MSRPCTSSCEATGAATATNPQRVAWLATHVARQLPGNRDNALFWAACRATEAGIDDLSPLLEAAVTAGLPRHQANRTIASAQRTITQGPATPPAALAR